MPTAEEMTLEEPRLVKQANGFGVKVTARAESIHMIKTGIRSEICPMVGTEEQAEQIVKYLIAEYEDAPERIWESNMFGKSLYDLVSDGMYSKLEHMPEESRVKLAETLERIINEGAGGLLCILL
jgi:stage IV sporulation protein A